MISVIAIWVLFIYIHEVGWDGIVNKMVRMGTAMGCQKRVTTVRMMRMKRC